MLFHIDEVRLSMVALDGMLGMYLDYLSQTITYN